MCEALKELFADDLRESREQDTPQQLSTSYMKIIP